MLELQDTQQREANSTDTAHGPNPYRRMSAFGALRASASGRGEVCKRPAPFAGGALTANAAIESVAMGTGLDQDCIDAMSGLTLKYADRSLQFVGEDMQTHLCLNLRHRLCLEVRIAHPRLQRCEGMLDRLPATPC